MEGIYGGQEGSETLGSYDTGTEDLTQPDKDGVVSGEIISEDGQINEEELSKLIEDETADIEPEEASNEFDKELGLYRHRLKSGEMFYTDTVNGAIVNHSVTLSEDSESEGEKLEFIMYKDGELLEDYTPGSSIEEPGSYQLYLSGESIKYKLAYSNVRPVFSFRIIGTDPVSDMGAISIPDGFKLESALYNSDDLSEKDIINDRYIRLAADGEYRFVFRTAAGMESLTLTVDRAAPRFYVKTSANEAKLEYVSEDIAAVRLYKGGRLIREAAYIDEINGSGSYRAEVLDFAGNMSENSFDIKYRVNTAAVIAIVIFIVLIAAVVVFFKNINKNIKVR